MKAVFLRSRIPWKMSQPLHIETPLLLSQHLSERVGSSVYLKLESLQNTGTFKIRGIGRLCERAVSQGCTRLICPSGGNAGLAATFAASRLNCSVTICVPESTPVIVREKLQKQGADVVVHGKAWDEANQRALDLSKQSGCRYIPPFDDPLIWEGISTMIDEVQSQLPAGCRPDLVVASVGGGGLLNGILEGMHHSHVGWKDVPVVAMETKGADSFAAAVAKGELVTLDAITSIATGLGAKRVSARSLAWTHEHPIHNVVIDDRLAIEACSRFADEHHILVEPACGAALAAVYTNCLEPLQKDNRLQTPLGCVVVIVCGGNSVSTALLEKWKKDFDIAEQ